jgi:hypothetical protein
MFCPGRATDAKNFKPVTNLKKIYELPNWQKTNGYGKCAFVPILAGDCY